MAETILAAPPPLTGDEDMPTAGKVRIVSPMLKWESRSNWSRPIIVTGVGAS